MNESASVLLAALLILAAGASMRSMLGAAKASFAETLAGAIVLGIAACGPIGSAAALLGLPVPASTAAGLALLAAGGAVRAARRGVPAFDTDPRSTALVLAVLALSVAVAQRAFTVPMAFGDEITVWGYKAAQIARTGELAPAHWSLGPTRGPAYPPALPIAGSLASVAAGSFLESGCRAAAWLGYVSFALAAGSLLLARRTGWIAFAAALVPAAAPIALLEAPAFMADLLFAAAVATALLEWSKAPASAASMILFASLAALKLEGLPMALLAMSAAAIAAPRGRARAAFAGGLALCACVAPWLVVAAGNGALQSTAASLDAGAGGAVAGLALHGAQVAAAVVRCWIDPEQFGLAFAAFAGVGFAVAAPNRGGAGRFAPFAIAAALAAGQIAALAVAPNFDWQLRVAHPRAALHLLPVLAFACCSVRGSAPSGSPASLDPVARPT